MADCGTIDKVLKRGGTDQLSRFVKALDPACFQLNDFEIEDWLLFAYHFAQYVQYYESADDTTSIGNWQDFFNQANLSSTDVGLRTSTEFIDAKEQVRQFLDENEANGTTPPHLALFVCFLQLLGHSKTRFNSLNKKHLDFYYKEVLQVANLKAKPDSVHVIFELAKKSVEQLIVGGTKLDAGKDQSEKPKPLIYETDEDLVANQAVAIDFKTVYNDIDVEEIKGAHVAGTLDGLEEALPKESPYWWPFGYPSTEKNFIELPNSSLGFAVAAPILALQEGYRLIEVTINFETLVPTTDRVNLEDITPVDLYSALQIKCSGVKDWIVPSGIITTNIEDPSKVASVDQNTLHLVFQLEKDTPALVGYDDKVFGEGFQTQDPLVQFNIDLGKKPAGPVGYKLFRALADRIVTNVTINVQVSGAKLVLVENDNSAMPADKPFYPFTTRPLKRSNFYVDYPEAFSKKWTDIGVKLIWNNTPDDFSDWYEAYISSQQVNTIRSTYLIFLENPTATEPRIVDGDDYFKATTSLLNKEVWDVKNSGQVLFENEGSGFKCDIVINSSSDYEPNKTGPLRLSLNQTFLHELFPRLYALALASDGTDTLIPNEPYTPLVGEISLDYTASESRTFEPQVLPITESNPLTAKNGADVYENERIRLFHLHPYGQKEEHNHLKSKARQQGVTDRFDSNVVNSYLIPKYCSGGHLFIGLENAKPLQSVALLIQVLEGSENPLTDSFDSGEGVHWSILCDNQWKSLKDDLLQDSTDNFLTSGIVKFNIPKQATAQNTLLGKNKIWIKAQMHKSYDVVCKVIGIHAQAVKATFEDNKNDVTHLQTGLPAGTISKMVTRIPQVKAVTQWYSSFDGLPQESDTDFYRRISERIRHKNRAISLWDYEHLILQHFPDIYKVKCLNHTKDLNFIAAGEVTVIVIPNMVDKNVFDIYQPRVSTGTLNKIADFINERNTMHVSAEVLNPSYEEVKVSLEAQFMEGYDASFYSKQMDVDIKKLLSPWAFTETAEIAFSVSLHRSMLINYLEKLEYVDFLQNVQITKNGIPQGAIIAPSNPKSILVSAKSHDVQAVKSNCKGVITEVVEPCQV